MRAGQLRKQIVFESPTSQQDAAFQDIPAWQPVLATWASVEQLRGTALALAQADTVAKIATHKITCRYNAKLVGATSLRIRLGALLNFAALTDEQLSGLSDADLAAMTDKDTPVRYFSINSIADNEERHIQMDLLATEVQGP